mgnify:CR=1 FL=1
MIPRQRHDRILELLDGAGAVRTVDLANRFSVTDETIRRDLEALHAEGRLVRTHGGAISTRHPGRSVGIREREIRNLERKTRIAAAAERFLRPRDVIYLDGSSTALQFARIIPALDLTVLTNAHKVIEVLKGKEGIEVIGTGGRFDALNDCYGGAMACQAFTRYRIQTAFFSGNGIDLKRGISESAEEQADLKAFALRFVERAVFLADSTKIGLRSTYFFSGLERIDAWITDDGAETGRIREFEQHIPSVIVVPGGESGTESAG